jgi:hypothetical protein
VVKIIFLTILVSLFVEYGNHLLQITSNKRNDCHFLEKQKSLIFFEPNGLGFFGFPIPAIHYIFLVTIFSCFILDKQKKKVTKQLITKKDTVPVGGIRRSMVCLE